MVEVRDEQLVIQKPAFEIFVPGRGLLYEQYSANTETPISFERSSRVFFFHELENQADFSGLAKLG